MVRIDLTNKIHQKAFFELLSNYMSDNMGGNQVLEISHCNKILNDLQNTNNYRGFLFEHNNEFVGLANCFVNYSTFKAKPLLNIHDYVIHSSCRGLGLGKQFMDDIIQFAAEQGYCRISLEVRCDNSRAQKLYKNSGFEPCKPDMLFWEKPINQ